MQVFALLSCVGVILALEDEQLYCGPRYTHLCLGKGQHVACQFPVAGSGPNCQNYSKIRFTNQLRNYITNFINKRRQRIAAGHERVRGGKHIPQPQVMMFVEWDFELARLAQRLADQCYFVHDECRATVRFPYAGQAVGEVRWKHLSNSYELSAQRGIRRVFDAWWGERRRVEPHQLVQPFRITDKGLVWGHFSQIAVWTLRAVGCGAVRHGEDYPRLLLVCDFSHTNMLGERTLNPGEAAPCPEHTRRKSRSNFPLLCASVKEQIKHSRIVEDDTLDETDYDDVDDDDSHVVRDELKKLVAQMPVPTTKPKTEEEDWTNVKKQPPEDYYAVEETTVKKWTTAVYVTDFNEEEEFTTATPILETKPPKRLKIRMKFTQPPTTEGKMSDEERQNIIDRYQKAEQKAPRSGYYHGYYDLKERLPADLRSDRSDEVEPDDQQETLILTVTPSPFVINNVKLKKQERYTNKINTTPGNKVIQNANMQYNPRLRWKPERDRERPERPGAAALLRPNQSNPPLDKHDPAIPPRISFRMDDDDAEQLHADTGFKPSWANDSIV